MGTNGSNSIESCFCDILTNHLSKLYKEWLAGIKISANYPFADEIPENFNRLYVLLVESIKCETDLLEMEEVCLKIAKERMAAKIGIDSFLHNFNLGRSIVIENLYLVSDSIIELIPLIKKINIFFDTFAYLLVEKYNQLLINEITEQQRVNSQNHSDKLSLLGQISSSFIHEFRNPLTSIIGFIQLLKSENQNIKYLDIIQHELNELSFRISQFLLTSKVDSHETGEKTKTSYLILLQEVIDFLYPRIVDLNIDIDFVKPDNDVYLFVKKEEMKQVLSNILINSFEAFPMIQQKRKVHITLEKIDNEAVLSISNNGPQIPEDKMKLIFEPFFTSKENGTGIGLFICKQIIEKYNGTIECSSNLEWTTFKIRLGL